MAYGSAVHASTSLSEQSSLASLDLCKALPDGCGLSEKIQTTLKIFAERCRPELRKQCAFQGVRNESFHFLLLLGLLTFGNANVITPTYSPHIPRVWDDAEMAKLQLPLVIPTASPKQVTADYYYRIPVRTIYKNYPVYVPGKEPAGYLEWLKQQEPQSAFEPSTFKTEATGSAQANSCSTRQFFTTTS